MGDDSDVIRRGRNKRDEIQLINSKQAIKKYVESVIIKERGIGMKGQGW